MTRKQLEDLGLTKEQADSVMKINGDDIENAKGTASTEIKNLQTEVEGLKTQVGDRDKQLETLKASAGDNADLKKQIEDLQTENATAKATHESELNQLKIDFAVEKALTGAKAKNIKAVKALLELGEAKLDKDGNVKGLDEQIEKLRSGDDTKFLFEAQKQQKQQQNSTENVQGVDQLQIGDLPPSGKAQPAGHPIPRRKENGQDSDKRRVAFQQSQELGIGLACAAACQVVN